MKSVGYVELEQGSIKIHTAKLIRAHVKGAVCFFECRVKHLQYPLTSVDVNLHGFQLFG